MVSGMSTTTRCWFKSHRFIFCLVLFLELSWSLLLLSCNCQAAAAAATTTTAAFTTSSAVGVHHVSTHQQQQHQHQVIPKWGTDYSVFSSSSFKNQQNLITDSSSSISSWCFLHQRKKKKRSVIVQMVSYDNDDDDYEKNDDNKFGFWQRIDSGKSFVVGSIIGSFALVIPEAIHQIIVPLAGTVNGLAQFEFDVDSGSLMTGLFAICYRYCIRMDNNPQLGQGVVGAFALTRTLSRIIVPSYCTPVVLTCGPPFGYLDWNMLLQIILNGAESFVMFGVTAMSMNYCMEKKWISKFPG